MTANEKRIVANAVRIAKRNTYMSETADNGGDFGGPASCEYGCGHVIAKAILVAAKKGTLA